jgi:Holliday junction resolvase RusA-like endonuclease
VPSAPRYHIIAPDLDKLQRAILDGFTDAGVWRDDSQVVRIRATKQYAPTFNDQQSGAAVRVTTEQ